MLNVNRQYSDNEANLGLEPSGLENQGSFTNDKTTSMLQKSKIVTYELCQDCGG